MATKNSEKITVFSYLINLFSVLTIATDIVAIICVDFPWGFCLRVEITRLAMAVASYLSVNLVRIFKKKKELVNDVIIFMCIGIATLFVFYGVCCGMHFNRYRNIDLDCKEGNFTKFLNNSDAFTWSEDDFERTEEGQLARRFCHSDYQTFLFEYNKLYYFVSTKEDPAASGFKCDNEKLDSIPNNPKDNINNLENLSRYKKCIGKRGVGIYVCSKSSLLPIERRLNNIINDGCLLNRHWNYSIVCYTLLGFFWSFLTFAWIFFCKLNCSDKEKPVNNVTNRTHRRRENSAVTIAPIERHEPPKSNDKFDPLKMSANL